MQRCSASEGSPGSASASEGSPGSASASEGSPGHFPEEPVGGLPPRPGPEHLLGFLWGVFMELKPDSWAPPVSKPPEFREGFEDEPPLIQVPEFREGFEDEPPLTIAPGPSDCVPGQIDVLPKAPDSTPDCGAPDSTPDYGAPDSTPDYGAPDSTPDSKLRGSSTLLGRPPDQPAGSRCRRRPPRFLRLCRSPRSLRLCRSPGLRRRRPLIRPLSSGS
ncbi:hypothetical protein CRENBAI_007713 [Crenichthys baileyi]|uniref:Uncharacterized protein n=1 Tax=Crenichthys baileyi TaxID=28760 RepID=A0AAV9QX82_9TELE